MIDAATGELKQIETEYTDISYVHANEHFALFRGGGDVCGTDDDGCLHGVGHNGHVCEWRECDLHDQG